MLVWLAIGDRRLSRKLMARMAAADTTLVVSAVVAWEYSDLQERGRFPHSVALDVLIEQFSLVVAHFPADAWRLAAALPLLHKDPVDRMLVAHAISIGMPLATADGRIHDYPVQVIW